MEENPRKLTKVKFGIEIGLVKRVQRENKMHPIKELNLISYFTIK